MIRVVLDTNIFISALLQLSSSTEPAGSFNIATSWNAASSTGALAYMDYPDVARYSRVYDLQEEFVRVQNRAFESVMGVYVLATLIDKGAKTISHSELENAERTLGLALANARKSKSMGNALNQEYVNILNQR